MLYGRYKNKARAIIHIILFIMDSLQRHLMAIFVETNGVVVTRVHRVLSIMMDQRSLYDSKWFTSHYLKYGKKGKRYM